MFLSRSRPLRYCPISLAALIVLSALLIGAFQIAVTRVPEYRGELQDWLSEKTGLVIEFKGISARLRMYGPELVFDDAIVRTPDRTRVLAAAQRGSVAFDLWSSIRSLRLTAGRFTLDSPELGLIRTRAGRIQLVGQSALPDSEAAKPISVESLPVGQFHVRNAVVNFRDEMTGRGPWSLSGISFRLDRHTDLLQLQGEASLPQSLGQSLEFSARVAGPLEDVDGLVSNLALEGHGLDLSGWADVLPDHWLAPETGHGSIELASTFSGVHPTAMTMKLDLSDVSAVSPAWLIPLPQAAPLVTKQDDDAPVAEAEPVVPAAAANEPVPAADDGDSTSELVGFDRLALTVNAVRHDNAWMVSASDVNLSRKASPWRADKIEVRWSPRPAGGVSLGIVADRLVLENLWPLLAYLPESETVAKLRALRAHGTVDDLSLNIDRPEAGQPARYSLKAVVTDAGFSPVLNAPGLDGISARIEGDEAGGTISLDADDVMFTLPRMFRESLSAKSVDAAVNWERLADGWRLSSDDLRVVAQDGKVQARIAVAIPADRSLSPTLELNAQAQDLNAAATSRYLPANKLTPKTLAWLDAAFAAGRVTRADVNFHGPVRAFPFRRREGEFVARGEVDGISFNYQDGWAPAERVAGVVEFRNQGMKLITGTAMVGGLQVSKISGDFADFKAGNLNVKAQAAGDLGDALRLLQTSPIADALGSQFQSLTGQGSTTADVSMRLPLKHIADRQVLVTTQLADAKVTSATLVAPVTSLSGSLTVRQSLPEAADLRGQWLGGPLTVAIAPVPAATPKALLTATGRAEAAQLIPLLHLPASVSISGATDWRLTTPLETASADATTPRQPRKFTIESALDGFGLKLPYPVGKAESESRPLHVEVEYDGDSTVLTRTAFGDLRALMRIRERRDGWHLDRGGVRADGIAAALPAHPGIGIDGSLDRLNLDEWLALKGNGEGGTPVSDYLQTANLQLGSLQIFGYEFPDVRGILRYTAAAWQVNVAGPNAQGELTIPTDIAAAQPLSVSLERLVIADNDRPGGQSGGRDPRSWPNLHVAVQDFRYEDHAIGAVTLQATRVPNGIRIDSLTVTQDAAHGDAHGQWLVTPDGEHTEMNVLIASTDVAATLRELNYAPLMEAKRGEISAELSWPGGFDSNFATRASGKVSVSADNGQLLTVQPGAGRVLGLFSVAALPRRLALDFSDLTDKGLSFDAIHGDFELREGNAYTSNVLLRGPAAEIGIAGRVGLAARDYDQTAVVTGNLGASLPVAGVLAGGPAVGAALLLFSQVFKEPLKGMTRGYYRITGPWDNPVIERVDAAQGKDAAATAAGET